MIAASVVAVIALQGPTAADALIQLMRQTDIQILFRYQDLRFLPVAPIQGDGSVGQALQYILKGTEYTWSRDNDARRTITIRHRSTCGMVDCEPIEE